MFDSLQSTHQLQVWQWLIYAFTICFLAYTLRRVCEAFWKYLENRSLNHFCAISGEKFQKNSKNYDFSKSEKIENNQDFSQKNGNFGEK